jgi:hypothetical protein
MLLERLAADLVAVAPEGRSRRYALNQQAFTALREWLQEHGAVLADAPGGAGELSERRIMRNRPRLRMAAPSL